MLLVYTIVVLYVRIHHVTGAFHCDGTCYSGQLFPLAEDIFYGKHLRGYSYRNITTDDAKKCYSSCVNDCRCKACQTKDAKCELLDHDKSSRTKYFVDAIGYVYYDLKQEFYKGKSHMVQPGVCHNGCCRSQICLNGGTCIEHCDTPKEKFTCKCPNTYVGRICEKTITRCYDVLKYSSANTTPPHGLYNITRTDNGKVKTVYCAFTANQSWTLIESFSLTNNNTFLHHPFYVSLERNREHHNWDDYRLSNVRMKYIRTTATMFRATCDFPKRVGSLTPDYLLGKLSDVDITSPNEQYAQCKRYLHINIAGYECFNCSAATYCRSNIHIHIDVSWIQTCDFRPQIKFNADSFGIYKIYDENHTCAKTSLSTTQWWLGEEH